MRPDDIDQSEASARHDAALSGLLRSSQLLEPDDLAEAVLEAAQQLGAVEIGIYLADHDQTQLRPLPGAAVDGAEPLDVDSTLPGRVYRTMEHTESLDGGTRRMVLPLVDGTDRLGVMAVKAPIEVETTASQWISLAGLVAELLIAKSAYGDVLAVTRRRKPMTLQAEAQQLLLPPLTFLSPRLKVAGMLMPSYEVAGDAFDYACNDDTLHVAIFDAMGHSLSATLIATVAVSAYRNARRGAGSLVDCWRAADTAVGETFDDERFATAVLAQLDLRSGVLTTISAGHPAALVVRGNRVVGRCADEPTVPLGLSRVLGGVDPVVTSTQLEPDDRLVLFSDGIIEARSDTGEFFGEDRLVEQLARALDTGLPAPEAARRLIHSVAGHQGGELRDDATILLVEWRSPDVGA